MKGWDALQAAIAQARAEVAAVAPDDTTAAEGEAYVARVFTACLNDALLGHLMFGGGLTRALPTRGGPNPDYRMAHAPIDPTQCYRLKGRLNDSERVAVGLYSFGPDGAPVISTYTAFDSGTTDPDGSFELEIAANADGSRALKILPGARLLLIRTLHRALDGQPASLVLEGASAPRELGLLTGSTEGALTRAAQSALTAIRQFLEWTAATSVAPNQFLAELPKLAQGVQGDADTDYHLGYFELEQGEWLEVTLPAGILGYWSLHAYNHWCESLPGAGAHDRNTTSEPDGRVRIAIGPNPPAEATNRIDTGRRHRGVLICRIVGTRGLGAPLATLECALATTNPLRH